MNTRPEKQVVVTSVFGKHAETLNRTFTSFEGRIDAELHAFILGSKLPPNQLDGVTYHLVEPDNTFGHPYREVCYRRWEYIDMLDAEYALVVDGTDVLCMQNLEPIEKLLKGAAIAACVEHNGGRHIEGQGYTSSYLNGGVTFWNIRKSEQLRQDVCSRGRSRCRTIYGDNQMSLNDVVHTRYFDDLTILPSQYNYRAFLNQKQRGWPTVDHLDGVMLYHNIACIDAAKQILPVKRKADLPALTYKAAPSGVIAQTLTRLRNRLRAVSRT